jgi:hypothetical protein
MPGVGSLVAGRRCGYAQFVLSIAGMLLTMVFAARFFAWYSAHMPRMKEMDLDPLEELAGMWMVARWSVLGIALFAMGWLWGLGTGLALVREAKEAERSSQPPKLV